MNQRKILMGDIVYSKNEKELETVEGGYLLIDGEHAAGVCRSWNEIPIQWAGLEPEYHMGRLIMPGLTDLHIHAPQYPFRALGMDMELLPWLERYAFPEESRYADLEYAKAQYPGFVSDLRKSATTRACIFGTIHRESTEYLMDELDKTGMCAYVGKVNMDRNAPANLTEGTNESAAETAQWLVDIEDRYENVYPILTPRFVPSCSEPLMEKLGEIGRRMDVPVQSHLSENIAEIRWVADLYPETACYAGVYDRFGLFGSTQRTVMAHCVHSDAFDEEMELLKNRNVWIAHCPESNVNLSSGLAPVRRYLREGIRVGLGSDVAGGSKLSIFSAMAEAIKVSKMYRLYVKEEDILTIPEVFYLATVGGGSFFGKVGSFEEGYEFDAVILDDSSVNQKRMSIPERLERLIYEGEKGLIVKKYVKGRPVSVNLGKVPILQNN